MVWLFWPLWFGFVACLLRRLWFVDILAGVPTEMYVADSSFRTQCHVQTADTVGNGKCAK